MKKINDNQYVSHIFTKKNLLLLLLLFSFIKSELHCVCKFSLKPTYKRDRTGNPLSLSLKCVIQLRYGISQETTNSQ